VAAVVLVAGTVAAISFGLDSLVASGTGETPRAFHGFSVVPDFPSASPSVRPVVTRVPARHPRPSPKPSPTITVTPTHTARPSPSPTVTPPPSIVVTFRIDNNWGSGFTAEIDVTNNRSTPISGWEIVVALPQDQFTGWWNAAGHMSNGILLLTPESWQGPVAAHGGTLRVYFNVNGSQTTPVGCAFNGIACGLPLEMGHIHPASRARVDAPIKLVKCT
jgi:cellulase/cellobiase CelA1